MSRPKKSGQTDQIVSLEDDAPIEQAPVSQLTVIIYGALFLISSVGNSIFSVKTSGSTLNYPLVVNQLTSFIYTPVFLAFVLITHASGGITAQMKTFPKWKYFIMGVLEGGGGAIYVIGLVKSPGSISVVLSQLGIPMTLICAYLMLRAKFHSLQYFGSFIIVTGVSIFNMGKGDAGERENNVFFNFLVLLGVLLQVISSIYKEIAFKGVDLDCNLVQYWVAYIQFFVSVCCLPIQSLPIFDRADRIDFATMPTMLYDGCMCVFKGVNTLPSDNCQDAFFDITSYLFFNILYNMFTLLLIKYASATFVQILSAVRLPLSQVLFYMPFIMGKAAQTPSIYHLLGLLIILGGIGVYRLGGFKQAAINVAYAETMGEEVTVHAFDLMNPADGGVTQSFLQGEVKSNKSTFVQSFVGGSANIREYGTGESFIGGAGAGGATGPVRRRHNPQQQQTPQNH